MKRLAVVVLAFTIVAVSCGGEETSADPGSDRLLIVATFSILGDVVTTAFGNDVDVRVLISGNQDPHSYRASPEQVALLGQADLVVANGLGLEEAVADILDAAVDDGARILFVGDKVEPLPLSGASDDGPFDPHFWFDASRMEQAVGHIRDELIAIDPSKTSTWNQSADAYQGELRAVDASIRETVDVLPSDARRIVTNHDSLRYFAAAYGFVIVGTVIPGASTLTEPSASDIVDLVETIEAENIQAIFADTASPVRLAEVVADEVGRDVVVIELYTGALGPAGTGAETYLGYLLTNTDLIVQALAE